MTRLLHKTIPNTLDTLIANLPTGTESAVQIWTFDSPAVRAAAVEALVARGITARVCSAYKPLIFAFLEEITLDAVEAITITYPTVAGADPDRFRLECYPLTDLVAPRPVTFTAGPQQDPANLLIYSIVLHGQKTRTVQVAAPNTMITDHTGARVLANTGWLQDAPVETAEQQALRETMTCLTEHPWPAGQGPYFDRLTITIAAPFYDHPLPVPGEHISTAEAMHEELYLGALEIFRQVRGLDPGDRTLQPGQVVPRIIRTGGPTQVTITTDTPAKPTIDPWPPAIVKATLDTATGPIPPAVVKATLDAIDGQPHAATSRQGRPVWATYVDGLKPGLVISANQHGNEASGIIGALRAAKQLTGIAFAVSPMENPDGYALYRDLCTTDPLHMHHAGRFTASGNDLEYAVRAYENEIRYWARQQTAAQVHLNLHGYPAHEWTRPWTGYIPRGMATWMFPKGFMLILRAKPGWEQLANKVCAAVADTLNADPELVAFNTHQIACYKQFFPDAGITLDGAIPIYPSVSRDDALFPITLITEAPDEGADSTNYPLFHTAHMRAVLAAADCLKAASS